MRFGFPGLKASPRRDPSQTTTKEDPILTLTATRHPKRAINPNSHPPHSSAMPRTQVSVSSLLSSPGPCVTNPDSRTATNAAKTGQRLY
jgi:hypothetical protein